MIKKPPGGRSAPWHQDHAYWDPEFNYDALGVWLPMHDVTTEMGAMQFIPGSHKRGLMSHHHAEEPEHNLLEVDGPFDASTAVSCELKKGGCTFHHAETLHYTAPNTTNMARLAFPTEFQIKPTVRAVPEKMPWVDQRRAATGSGVNYNYVADGKLLSLKEPA
jgi:ectoine hydroxylase-related dioxygenase (phytanoyl-CoA dioxygenase family)